MTLNSGENLLTHNEALEFINTMELPQNFIHRLYNLLEFHSCSNCDDVRCMHFVFRDWWSGEFNDCDGYCCPDCGEWTKGRRAAEAIASFFINGSNVNV